MSDKHPFAPKPPKPPEAPKPELLRPEPPVLKDFLALGRLETPAEQTTKQRSWRDALRVDPGMLLTDSLQRPGHYTEEQHALIRQLHADKFLQEPNRENITELTLTFFRDTDLKRKTEEALAAAVKDKDKPKSSEPDEFVFERQGKVGTSPGHVREDPAEDRWPGDAPTPRTRRSPW